MAGGGRDMSPQHVKRSRWYRRSYCRLNEHRLSCIVAVNNIMKTQSFLGIIYVISFFGRADSFCGSSSDSLHADLTRAVVRSSDWLTRIYKDNNTKRHIQPYRACSIFATLRIAGHHSTTLLTDFKDATGLSIEETLKNKLDSLPNGSLSAIPTPHLGLIIQGVISICKDPRNFHGHGLIQPLLDGFPKFKTYPRFNNYFGYGLAVIALCNSGEEIPEFVIKELLNGANRKVNYYIVDIDAMILTALSCVSSPKSFLQREVDQASVKLVHTIISKQNRTNGAFGNHISTALVVEAFRAARVPTDDYLCEKAMRHILSYQDQKGSFGTILANTQIPPSLVGESLINLKKYACPVEPSPTPPPQIITVHVQLVFNVTNLTTAVPAVSVSNILQGTTVYKVLEKARLKNPCYKATYTKRSFGRSITSICCVAKDWKKKHYWLIYVNGKTAQYGVDRLKPKDGDLIIFKYKKLNF